MNYPKSFQNLVEEFQKLPGVGIKTAERFAFSLLENSKESVEDFSKSILDMKNKIRSCKICGNLSETDICEICSNEKRNKNILCVVENIKTILPLEQSGIFNGVYHVLGGLISPMEGIGPENLNLNQILRRIKEEEISEIILALKPSIEGETTSLYLKEILKDLNVKVTRIAYGIPLGFDIEYIDTMTWQKAFEDRNQLI